MKHKSKRIFLFTSAVVILIGGYLGYGYLVRVSLEHKFSKLNDDINTLSDAISKKNPELSPTKTRYCRHDQEKFGGGLLSCNILLKLSPVNEAMLSSIEDALALDFNNQADIFKPNSIISGINFKVNSIHSFKNTHTGIDCLLNSDVSNPTGQSPTYTIYLSCGRYVPQAIFPVTD